MKLFMEPRSIALVGVPRDTGQDAKNVLENLLTYGYKGRIYPVNPNCKKILDIETFCNVADLPETPDLAVIMTPQHLVFPLVKDTLEKGIKALVVVAQGFSDSGEEGKLKQSQLVDMVHRAGARLVGPNSFGVANAFLNLNTAFVLTEMERKGVGIICQTGFPFVGFPQMIILGKGLDLGNTGDIDFADGLEYFENDEETRVIILHIEGIKNGRRFMETARRVSRLKPVVALKTGWSKSGEETALSHSGSLVGNDDIYEAVFKQSGILRVQDTEEFIDVCRAFLAFPRLRGRRLAVLTMTMAGGTMAADACEKYSMRLASFTPETLNKLSAIAPPWLKFSNPLDSGAFYFSKTGPVETFRITMEAVLLDPQVDALLIVIPALPFEQRIYAEIAFNLTSRYPDKPVTMWLYASDKTGQVSSHFESTGRILNFGSIDRAVRALSRLADYSEYLDRGVQDGHTGC